MAKINFDQVEWVDYEIGATAGKLVQPHNGEPETFVRVKPHVREFFRDLIEEYHEDHDVLYQDQTSTGFIFAITELEDEATIALVKPVSFKRRKTTLHIHYEAMFGSIEDLEFFLEHLTDNNLDIILIRDSEDTLEGYETRKVSLNREIREQIVRVRYWWSDGKAQLTSPVHNEPFFSIRQFSLPEVGQDVVLPLPMPRMTVQEHPAIMINATVEKVRKDGNKADVYVRRIGYTGLTYKELCVCVGMDVLGHHPLYGKVEGRLSLLHPHAELAGIEDERLAKILNEINDEETSLVNDMFDDEDDFDFEEDEENEMSPIVWVAFSTIWLRNSVKIKTMSNDLSSTAKNR